MHTTPDLDIHGGQAVSRLGPPVGEARLVVLAVHGRGGSAEDILALARELEVPDVTYLAPQAQGHTWYPKSFLAPLGENEPGLTSAVRRLETLVAELRADGVGAERVALLGFSQGACLALEYVARHARRYAGVAALSGGLIGPPGTPRDYPGSLEGTPVFLGCGDLDSHVPVPRVRESAEVLRRMGAAVDERIYRGMGHAVNRDELQAVTAMFGAVGR